VSNIKASNPKDAIGSRKVGLSRVSMPVMMEVDVAMFEGAMKYGRHNYRAIGIRSSVYFDATLRHLFAWWEGQDIDPDSGLHHITKAIAGLMVVRDAMLQGKVDDDRPPRHANDQFVAELNAKIAALIEKYPEPVEPWTETRMMLSDYGSGGESLETLKFYKRVADEAEASATFSDLEWHEAQEAHMHFCVAQSKIKDELNRQLAQPQGTCCTAMVGPGRLSDVVVLEPYVEQTKSYDGVNRRAQGDLTTDRRVNKKFDSNTPNLRRKQLHEASAMEPFTYHWGRRITDPLAY
jgi:hypothetical protein